MTRQSHQLDAAEHLTLSGQFEAIQNEARQEATAQRSEYLKQIFLFAELTPIEITPKIYTSLTVFEQSVVQD